jgi:hypothetical protein
MMNYLAIKEQAENQIYKIRGVEVMIDSDLADMYEIKDLRELNRKVSENPEKFPNDTYYFDLTQEEKRQLMESDERWEKLKFSSKPPKAYTEYGILMLATTFHKSNETAIKVCHILVQTFVEYRKKLKTNATADSIIAEIRRDVELLKNFALIQHEKNGDFEDHFGVLFQELNQLKTQPQLKTESNPIGFQPTLGSGGEDV